MTKVKAHFQVLRMPPIISTFHITPTFVFFRYRGEEGSKLYFGWLWFTVYLEFEKGGFDPNTTITMEDIAETFRIKNTEY